MYTLKQWWAVFATQDTKILYNIQKKVFCILKKRNTKAKKKGFGSFKKDTRSKIKVSGSFRKNTKYSILKIASKILFFLKYLDLLKRIQNTVT